MHTVVKTAPLLAALALTGCQVTGDPSEASQAPLSLRPPAEAVQSQEGDLAFLDSRLFDEQLSGRMSKGVNPLEVVLRPGGDVTLNNLPDRLDRWLYTVDQSGGRVAVASTKPGDERALLGIALDLASFAWEKAEEQRLYGPAENYDALLRYDPDTGVLEEVVFTPRKTTATP